MAIFLFFNVHFILISSRKRGLFMKEPCRFCGMLGCIGASNPECLERLKVKAEKRKMKKVPKEAVQPKTIRRSRWKRVS